MLDAVPDIAETAKPFMTDSGGCRAGRAARRAGAGRDAMAVAAEVLRISLMTPRNFPWAPA